MEFARYFVILMLFLGPNIVRGKHRCTYGPHETTHDVTQFGAVGNGKADDTEAFELAWEAACSGSRGNVTISVPSEKTFLVSRIEFEGPCKSTSITFEILGKVVAPPRSKWRKKYEEEEEWLYFHKVDRLAVIGNGKGLIDGNGDSWWSCGADTSRPTAMRFSHCNGVEVSGLKHVNSQKNHISINQCNNVLITQLHIIAPIKSPNTDGIDISGSTNVSIHDCIMETGDDCIAINGGSSRVNISGIACGPGHGISIGSLGKDGGHDEVEAVTISNCTFKRTENGVRIKTWQGGSGFARRITFSQINFIESDNPVIIDQYYCPHQTCSKKKSAVKVSDVKYIGLQGTSIGKDPAINFNCSHMVPCTDIELYDVNILSADPRAPSANCINAHVTEHSTNLVLHCSRD